MSGPVEGAGPALGLDRPVLGHVLAVPVGHGRPAPPHVVDQVVNIAVPGPPVVGEGVPEHVRRGVLVVAEALAAADEHLAERVIGEWALHRPSHSASLSAVWASGVVGPGSQVPVERPNGRLVQQDAPAAVLGVAQLALVGDHPEDRVSSGGTSSGRMAGSSPARTPSNSILTIAVSRTATKELPRQSSSSSRMNSGLNVLGRCSRAT